MVRDMISEISVVIPHLPERGDFLPRAVRSVADQSLQSAAIHVAVDLDRSGPGPTRNRGLACVQTPWTAFLDDDDEWLPHHLETLWRTAQDTGAGLVYSKGYMDVHPALGQPFNADRLRRENFISPLSILVRTQLVRSAGGFQCPHGEACPYGDVCQADEYGLYLKLLDMGVAFAHVPVVTCRVHLHGSNTHVLWAEQKIPSYRRVAPVGTADTQPRWEGRIKPWRGYQVTAVIAHLDTLEALEMAVLTLRAQSVRPYVVIVDTGSPPNVCDQLERLRAQDLEVHFVRAHSYANSSEPVAVALDVGHALCRTEHIFHTHSDVFLRRRDFLAWLLERCNATCPVVGYEMSPRAGTDEWRGTPSHTATMLHAPTMDRIGASWSMRRWKHVTNAPAGPTHGWPDTESMMGLSLKKAGIQPFFITPETCPGARLETNYERHVDVNLDHVRSFPGSKIYGMDYHRAAAKEMIDAIRQARQRVARWQRGEP